MENILYRRCIRDGTAKNAQGDNMKIVDKLAKINDSFTINIYDNGYMVEVGGHDKNDEWSTAKIVCKDEKELLTLVQEAFKMDRT